MSKVAIEGNASGTGTLTIAAPNTNSNFTLTIPDATTTIVGTDATQTLTNKSIVATQLTGTIAAARLPAGSVLQVLQTAKTDTFSTSSTSFVDLTGMSVSITPSSATSKIMVFVAVNGSITATENQYRLRLMRDSTAIAIGDAAGSRIQASNDAASPTNTTQVSSVINFLDSPSSTSATVYKVQIQANVAVSVFINRREDDPDSSLRARTVSTITVMEIAG